MSDQNKFIPMAVVGMACKLPGASNLEEYWSLLYEGRSGIVPFPNDRLDKSLYYSDERGQFGKSYCKVGGIVDYSISKENSSIINDELMKSYDLCQTTLLDVVLSAVRHAGWGNDHLVNSRTGIYIGNSDCSNEPGQIFFHSHRKQVANLINQVSSDLFPNEEIQSKTVQEVIKKIEDKYPSVWDNSLVEFASNASASLVAQVLKTKGPCMALDAACASSSVALLSAQHALKSNRVDTAIVGAASFRTWYELVMFSQIQALGTKQSCPFDASADGFIGADGYASVILKTLDKAINDGDQIHGVIQSIGLSSDGRGKSFWAPRTEGQSLAIKRAYEPGFDQNRIQYLETHATSTQLGDATEIQSLMDSIGCNIKHKIPIGSVKANIGHSLETAGLASLIKVLLGMKNGFIPPAINISSLNKDVDWDSIPFYPPPDPVEWIEPEDGHPRRAGIDAFGIGGLNSHLIVDQFNDYVKSDSVTNSKKVQDKQSLDESSDIAVIGMGCLLPGAYTVQDFWDQLIQGETGIYKISDDREFYEFENLDGKKYGPEFSAGYLKGWDFDWKKYKIPPKQLANANPIQFMVLDAAAQALSDAGYDNKDYDQTRVGTVVGSIFSSNFAVDTFLALRLPEISRLISGSLESEGVSPEDIENICSDYEKIILQKFRASQDESASFNSSTTASRITKVFDLMGGAFAVDAGDASSMASLNVGMDLLNNHVNDMVICAAGHQKNTQIVYEQYMKKGFLASIDGKSPFDVEHGGIVPGEGAAVVILKRLEDAKRDGDRIYGVINHITSSTDLDSSRNAFSGSITELSAGIQQVEVLPYDLNGSSFHLKNFIKDVPQFKSGQLAGKIYPSCLVSQFGDLGGASSMAALIKNLKSLETGVIPATYGLENIDPEILNNSDQISTLNVSENVSSKENMQALITSDNHNGFQNDGASVWSMLLSSKDKVRQAVAGTEQSHKPSKEFVGDALVQLAVEQTGFPIEIVNLGSSLEYDLNWKSEELRGYLRRIDSIFQFEGELLDEIKFHQVKVLGDVLDQIVDKVKTRTEVTMDKPLENSTGQYMLRAVESVLRESDQKNNKAQAMVVIGSNFLLDSMVSLNVCPVYAISSDLPVGQIVTDLENILREVPSVHLLISSELDAVTTLSVESILQLIQKWNGLISNDQQLLTIVTQMGGDLGLSGHSLNQQTLSDWMELFGLLEKDHITFKLIDFSPRDPDKLVSKLVQSELLSGNRESAVSYIRGTRHVVRAIPQLIENAISDCPFLISGSPKQSGFKEEIYPDDQQKQAYENLQHKLNQSGMIQDAVITDSGRVTCHTSFLPVHEPFLTGHRVPEIPLLPAVVGIELLSESAFIASDASYVTGIRDLKLVNGFWMPNDQEYHAKIDTSVEGNVVHCQLKGDYYDKNQQFIEPHRLYQSAIIEVSDQPVVIPPFEYQVPDQGDWYDVRYASHWTRMEDGDSGVVFYGPEMRALKQIQLAQNGIWGRLIAPTPVELGGKRTEGKTWHFPSTLFDSLLFNADLFLKFSNRSTSNHLPSEIEYIQFSQLPEQGEPVFSWTQFQGEDKRKVTFDCWLFKADGTVILSCKNFTLVKLL